MSKLAQIVFSDNKEREIEVEGHKLVVRSLTARDTMEMDVDLSALAKDDVSMKTILKNNIAMLASVIVSVDGIVPDNKKETEEFLLNLEQRFITEILSKADILGTPDEELKNSLDPKAEEK